MGRLPKGRWSGNVAVTEDRIVCQIDEHLYSRPLEDGGSVEWSPAKRIPGVTGKVSLAGFGNRLFLVGGLGREGKLPLVRSVDFEPSGEVSAVRTHPPLPIGIAEGGLVAGKGRLYWVGGVTHQGPSGHVLSTPLDGDGVPGDWEIGFDLPVGLKRPVLQVWKDRLWVIGGGDRSNESEVWVSEIGGGGRLGKWGKMETNLPEPVTGGAVVHAGGRFLLLGGWSRRPPDKPLAEVYSWVPS